MTDYVGDNYDAGFIPSSAEEKEAARKFREATEAEPSVSSVVEKVCYKYFMSAVELIICLITGRSSVSGQV